jgi:hypothetical protein
MNKSILKVVGVVAVAAALCVGCGGDNGVSGGIDPAIYGTWVSDGSTSSITFNRDGTYSTSSSSTEGRIKYTTNGTNLTLTVTGVYDEKTGTWLNREQYSKMMEEKIKDVEEKMKDLDPSSPNYESYLSLYQNTITILRMDPFVSVTYTYSIDGNTLTICQGSSCAVWTKQ